MTSHQEKQQPTFDKQARLMLLGGMFAAGLAAPAPAPAETLTVNQAGSGGSIVTGAPSGVDCGLDCSESYHRNTDVKFTSSYSSGASGTVDSGASGTVDSGASGTVDSGASGTVDVTSTAGPGGSINPAGTQRISAGVSLTFTVIPDRGYTASVDSTCSGNGVLNGSTYITNPIWQDCTVAATFNRISYRATAVVTGPGGSISPSFQTVPFGEKTTFTVTPADASYSINRVEGCDGTLSGNIYTTGEMIADCTVSASFTQTNPSSYTVTATADNNGRIDPSGSQIVTAGASITFIVNPNAGYAILTVTGCNGKLTDKSYTTGPITANCAVNARFAPQTLPADGALESVQAPDSAGPNQTVPLSVRFTEGQQPRPNTPVGWAVTAADGQPLPTNVTGRLRAAQTQTGADGIATNQFESGGQQFNYRIIATVNTQSGPKTVTFPLAVGLAPIVGNPTTPEGAMALYIDRTCANLFLNGAPNPAAQQLQFRCGQLTQITNPVDAAYVMNQLTPRNNPEAANLGQNFNSRQLGNVLSRLAALRHGATGVSLSGLSINQNGQSLSASALGKAFAQQKGGAAGDEPGADLGGRLGIFVNGTINRGDKSRTTQESGFDYDAYDITGGVDYRFTDRFVAGFALGYSSTSSDLNYSGGNLDGSGYTLAGYANYFFGDNVFLDGVAQYGRGNFDMQRNINYIIPGVTKEFFTASASPDAQQWGASIGGGYDFKFDGQGTQATLSGHLNYLKATLNSYDESGAETFDLHVDQNTLKSLTLSLGGEISHAFSMSWGILTPRLRADWVHEFEDNSVPIGGWLLADPIGGTSNSFTYQSDKQDPNYFLLGAGASAVFSHGVQAFLFYQATLDKENYTDNQITAGVRFEF